MFSHTNSTGSPHKRGQIHALVKLAFGDGALAEEAGRDDVLAAHVVGERKPDRERQPAADDGIAAVEIGGAVEQMHGAAAPAAASLLLAVHLGERRRHRHAAHQRMAMLAVGRDDPVALLEHRDDADGDRLLAVIEMQEASDLLLGVELGAFVLEPANADHLLQQVEHMRARQARLVDGCGHRSSLSSVEMSPSGRPSSRALSSRRMILPLRVFGRFWRNAMSFGAIAGPRRWRAWPSSSLRSASLGSKPFLSATKALTTSPAVGSGNADHAGLGDGRMLHQRALHLERADQMAGALDDVVRPADEPVVALVVAHREVAGEIPAADEALAVAFLLVEIGAHHRRPARAQRELAHDHRLGDLAHGPAFKRARRCRP